MFDLSPVEMVAKWGQERWASSAVIGPDEVITYGALCERASAIAAKLAERGLAEGQVIVTADRSAEAVAAFVGVAWAGAVYVPVDPEEPGNRVQKILESSGARAVVCTAACEPFAAGLGLPYICTSNLGVSGRRPMAPRRGEGAYMLFTSGSTGVPKGVQVTTSNLTALLAGAQSWARPSDRDVWACFHAFTFDISVWEIWGALTNGASVVVMPRTAQLDPLMLCELLEKHRVTRLCQTPTALAALMTRASNDVPSSLHSLFIAGERLDFQTLAPVAPKLEQGSLEAWNLYGPTETTVYATGRRISPSEARREHRSLIGLALPHVQVDVRDEHGLPRESGEEGEIWISGSGVADGYMPRSHPSNENFGWSDGVRYFRTGDYARSVDGDIEFIGRRNGFVKVRGFRIEPDEVAHAIRSHDQVADTLVVDVHVGSRTELVAVVVRADSRLADRALRDYVAQQLPTYMRPARIVFVDRLPMLPSAKIDREAVRALARLSLCPESEPA
jgi:amino acid adenylation domain-containing protein